MGILDRLLGRRAEEETPPVALDATARRPQLLRLEQGLDALAAGMREAQTIDNPGWRARVNEYSRLAGEAARLRSTVGVTRDDLLDLVFEVRPVYSGAPPEGLAVLEPLQQEVLAAAEALREALPSERG